MKQRLVFHPFLFALAPILSLYAHNIDQIPLKQTLPATAVVMLSTLAIFLIPALLFKNFTKTGLIVSAFVLLFFTYGHLAAGHSRYFILLAGPAVLVVVAFLVIRTRRSLHGLTGFVNLLSVCVIVVMLASLVRSLIAGDPKVTLATPEPGGATLAPEGSSGQDLPDIYYIVLDGYARADILQELYDHDNTPFIDELRQRGFYVAQRSRSNYCQTLLSLASTFNMVYLDTVAAQIGYEQKDRKPLMSLIKSSYVFAFLSEQGYETFAFASGYSGEEIRNADHFMAPGLSLNEFEHALIDNTALSNTLSGALPINQFDIHRGGIRYTLDHLGDLPDSGRPRFVFAPILAPHPPFVFGAQGEELDVDRKFSYSDGSHYMSEEGASLEEYREGYRAQLTYLNRLVLETIDEILSPPGRDRIIILQADHGPGSRLEWEKPERTHVKERLSILNAFYLPNGGDTL